MNGRVRDRVEAAAALSDDELVELAKGSEKVQAHLDGKEIRQAVVVPVQARELRRLNLVDELTGAATAAPRR